MSHRISLTALLAVALLAGAAPAQASSMPRAAIGPRPYLGIGLGNGVSLSFDAPLNANMALGGSIGSGFVYNKVNSLDARFLYKLMHGATGRQPWIDLLVGAQGGGAGWALGAFEPTIGVATQYNFTPQLAFRLNLVMGVFNRGTGLSGLEIGYKFAPNFEGTIGGNGRGDFIGMKFDL